MSRQLKLTESYWPADTSEALLELTLGELLRQAASEVPERIALVDGGEAPGERRQWSYAQLFAIAQRVACALLARFQPGERLAVCAPNRPEWLFLHHGMSLAGMVMVPVNPAYKSAELQFVLESSRASGVFYADSFRDNDIAAMVAALRPRLPGLREAVPLSRWDDWLAAAPAAAALPATRPETVVQIQYTSGSTGFPKGACLHHRGVINNARFVALSAGLPDGGVWVNAMPMFHAGGNITAGVATLSRRGTLVMAPGFDAALMLELIESYRGNLSLLVPTMILDVLEQQRRSPRDVSSLRTILTGATVVPAALVHRTKEALGCEVAILFGQSELSGNVTRTHLDDGIVDKTETIGQPLPQIELKIADPATGAIQALGTPGEICVRGYQAMTGYFDAPEATLAAQWPDGWLRTGDLGAMDERGYLRIVGRLKDMIIRGGMNIYPREVEDALFDHPGVAQVSVVGAPDARWGEVVAAVILPESPELPPDPEQLHAWCRERLAPFKTPALWFFTREFPLTASGKIQKFVLQEWMASGRLRAVERAHSPR